MFALMPLSNPRRENYDEIHLDSEETIFFYTNT